MPFVRPLDGTWQLAMVPAPALANVPPAEYPQTMQLPGTTAQQQLGTYNTAREEGVLTERYPFAGQIWLRRVVQITPAQCRRHAELVLERTRITTLFVNGRRVGGEKSLCTPHRYDLTGLLTEETELVLCVQNTEYPTKGGHMTAPDTQTNWIGITGMLTLVFHADVYLSGIRVFPDAANRRVTLRGRLHGAKSADAALAASAEPDGRYLSVQKNVVLTGENWKITVALPDDAPFWSEYTPHRIALTLTPANGEPETVRFGLRDFCAAGDHFTVNGVPAMLRGKHDALIFPLTGAAPTDLASWMKVFRTAKDWGINHYRFHTCCPPEAAFEAADRTGIYLEPELPFWGTVHAPGEDGFNAREQAYLIREGLRICEAFGNHPSFCMLSLGNELWGSKERLGEIIRTLRAADPRPLYTQGSNNFQHMPVQLPEEDFWTGVRTGKGRLLRGSYADCDAPLGRLQTHAPSADWDFSDALTAASPETAHASGAAEIDIQYGTGVRRVKAEQSKTFVPNVPIVTHEVGQYNVFPDFREIPQYTGVLEARNFGIFRERLERAGMGDLAEKFFRCSGAFARDCYKMEIEAAMRTPQIAGFQLLDLQDYTGQGTALVGMLNAFLESKGLISSAAWRGFCGDLVLLALFDSYVRTAGETMHIGAAVRCSRPDVKAQPVEITMTLGGDTILSQTFTLPAGATGLVQLGEVTVTPQAIGKAVLTLSLPASQITNTWQITVLPPASPAELPPEIAVVHRMVDALPLLHAGRRVLLLPAHDPDAVRGFYCTDFWNYHMFKIISESMGKQVPVGTMGLCIDSTHPIAQAMFSEEYSTPQWYVPVTHADCAVLRILPEGFRPIVQMIDNVERCERLMLLYEAAIGTGKLLVCTVRFDEAPDDPAMNRLKHAVISYLQAAGVSQLSC